MIFHLSAAGSPTNWNVTAVYKDCLGVAITAAGCWYNKNPEKSETIPQCVIQIKDGKNKHERLWIHGSQMMKEQPIPEKHLINFSTAPFEIPEETQDLVFRILRRILIDRGYFIPQVEWEIRYPAQHLRRKRFDEFNVAFDDFRKNNPGEEMPFEGRWAWFMPVPSDFKPTFHREQNSDLTETIYEILGDGGIRNIEESLPPEIAIERCRLYNSGWDKDQVDILMRDEPIS